MATEQTNSEHVFPSTDVIRNNIMRLRVGENNFTIPTQIISMIQRSCQYHGLTDKDPNYLINNFLEFYNTFKIEDVSDDAVRLRLFLFSLVGKAHAWLTSLAPSSVTIWNDMAKNFLHKFFSLSKANRLYNMIYGFEKEEEESFSEVWDCYKELQRNFPHHGMEPWMVLNTFYNRLWTNMAENFLHKFFSLSKENRLCSRIYGFEQEEDKSFSYAWFHYKKLQNNCPHHGIEPWMVMNIIYNGLCTPSKQNLDTLVGGVYSDLTPIVAHALIKNILANDYLFRRDSRSLDKGYVRSTESNAKLTAQVEALTSQIKTLIMKQKMCSTCEGSHATENFL